jgi:hypothetical protein
MERGRAYRIKKAIVALIIVIAVVFLINSLSGVIGKKTSTFLPIEEQYVEKLYAQGIVIKDEKTYDNPYSGEIYRVALEGERVHVGAEIANVLSGADLTSQKNELMEINQQIEHISGDDKFEADTISRLQAAVSSRDYENVHNLKGDISMQLDYLIGKDDGSSNLNDYISSISKRRDALKTMIDNNVNKIFSAHSGIVSFELDGFEEFFSIYDLDNITVDSFTKEEKLSREGKAFKIVDSFDWILAFLVNDRDLVIGDYVELVIRDEENSEFELSTPIISYAETSDGAIYCVKSNLFLEDLYNSRFVDVEIIKIRKDALKIPRETIIVKDNSQGVLVKEFYGVARFRPINIIGVDEKYVFVEIGDSYGYIEDNEGNRKKTINIYTEVLLTPGDYTEGEILQ